MRFVIDRILPKEYKRLKYLENTAGEYANEGAGKPTNVGSYINTGIHPNQNGKVKIGMQFNDWTDNIPYQCVFGGYDNNTKNFGVVVQMKDSHTTYFMDGSQTFQTILDYVADTHYDFEYDAVAKTFTVNGTSYNFSGVTGLQTQSELNIYLFTDNSINGSMNAYDTTYTMKGKIYYFKYFEGNSLKNNLIPALRISDNEPGMYDTITGNFFTNAGIGSFSYELEEEPDSRELLNNPNYKQVEYIESVGAQYIDTGIYLSDNHSVEIDFQMTVEDQKRTGLFGGLCNVNNVTSEDDYGRYGVLTHYSSGKFEGGYGKGNTIDIIGIPDLNRHTYYQNKEKVYFDNTLVKTFTSSTFRLGLTAPLGSFNYTNYTPSYCRYYHSRWWDGDTLVRNFIPAVRKSDNKPGLYDTINDTFYVNAGTGEFLHGPFVGPLPKEYEELDYIESNGNQYIDTGFNIVTSTDEIQLNFQLLETENYKWLFGEHDNNARLCIGSGDGVDKRNVAYYNDTKKVTDAEVYNSKHEFKINSTGVYLNGSKKSNYASFTSTSTLYLFNLNLNGGTTYKAKGKIWSYKHSRNGQWLIDLVPCYKKSNNEVGLYDRVTGKFFANQGTGSFIKGEKGATFRNEITRLIKSTIASSAQTIGGYRRIDYLESDGAQYIDTGIKGKNTLRTELTLQTLEITKGTAVFGTFDNNSSHLYYIYQQGSPEASFQPPWQVGMGDFENTSTLVDLNKHTFILDDNKVYLDGNILSTFTQQTFTTARNLVLFNMHKADNTLYTAAPQRLYSCKMIDNGTLVRDYIPVLDENDEPCLYDTITKQLYKNRGTGSFTYGEVLESSGTRLLTCVSDYYKDYRPLKYIQSTGTQYIDSGVYVNSTLKTEIEFEIVDRSTAGHIFGGRTVTAGGNGYGVFLNTAAAGIGFDYEGRISSNVATKNNIRYKVIKNGASNVLYANGVQVYSGNNEAQEFDLEVKMAIFYMKDVNNPFSSSVKCKIYNLKISDNGILIRNFIPLLRKSDNKPGLYDRVNNVFYTNEGTDEFLYETA